MPERDGGGKRRRSADANEITDKGYINQRAVVERRADLIDRLYADPPHPDVIPAPRGA